MNTKEYEAYGVVSKNRTLCIDENKRYLLWDPEKQASDEWERMCAFKEIKRVPGDKIRKIRMRVWLVEE